MISKVMKDKIKETITNEILKIAQDQGIKNLTVDFIHLDEFMIYMPFLENKDVSASFHPDFVNTLIKNNYDIRMQYSHKTKGMILYGFVTKKI